MEKELDYLNIPFIKLHFTAEVIENCVLPKSKSSGLRGGTGQMMIQQNCILADVDLQDEDCKKCDCISECLVQRFLYTPFEIEPDLSIDKGSMGYIFECEDYREVFQAGETFQFNVLLFGKSRVYVNVLLQALWSLGNAGLGNHNGRFVLREITNSKRQPVMIDSPYGPQILKERLVAQPLSDYVRFRKNQMEERKGDGDYYIIKFQKETSLKYQKELIQEFSMEAIVSNLARRIYLFNCFIGQEMDYKGFAEMLMTQLPEVICVESRPIYGKRYSTRQKSAMPLRGIIGSITIKNPSSLLLDYLYAGEILHIGKQSSLGFGRYRVL